MAIPLATAAMISGGMSTASGIFGSISNARIAAKQRAQQYKMFLEANQFNANQATLAYQRQVDEWNRQFNLTNQYNDPSAQMQRLTDAGINPYNAAQSVSPSSSAMSVGSSSAPSSAAPPYDMPFANPVSSFFSSAQQGLNTALQVLQATGDSASLNDRLSTISTNADISKYNAKFSIDTLPLRIDAANQANKALKVEDANRETIAMLRAMNIPEQVATEFTEIISARQQAILAVKSSGLSVKAQETNLKYLDRQFDLTIQNLSADLNLKGQQSKQMEKALEYADRLYNSQLALQAAQTAQAQENANDLRLTRPYRIGLMSEQAADLRETRPYRNGLMSEQATDLRQTRWSRNNQMNMNAFYMQQQGYGQRQQNWWFTPDASQLSYHGGGRWKDPSKRSQLFLYGVGTLGNIIRYVPFIPGLSK